MPSRFLDSDLALAEWIAAIWGESCMGRPEDGSDAQRCFRKISLSYWPDAAGTGEGGIPTMFKISSPLLEFIRMQPGTKNLVPAQLAMRSRSASAKAACWRALSDLAAASLCKMKMNCCAG